MLFFELVLAGARGTFGADVFVACAWREVFAFEVCFDDLCDFFLEACFFECECDFECDFADASEAENVRVPKLSARASVRPIVANRFI